MSNLSINRVSTPSASHMLSVSMNAQTASSSALSGRTINVIRESAGDFDDCFSYVRAIPIAINTFFAHRYADFRMFIRAFISMGNGTTSHVIDDRINIITRFRGQVAARPVTRADLQGLQQSFIRLGTPIQDLFFYVDNNYMQSLVNGHDINEEIIRECDQAIVYQHTLTSVNSFYRMFSGTSNQAPPAIPTRDDGGTTMPRRAPDETTSFEEIPDDFTAFDWMNFFRWDNYTARRPDGD